MRAGAGNYRDLMEKANSIILRMDTHGVVTFVNEFAERFFLFTKDEMLGRNVVGTIVPDFWPSPMLSKPWLPIGHTSRPSGSTLPSRK